MLFFSLKRTFKLGAKSIWMHRLRSTLTALGIIFGVSSVIAMLAIGEGASRDAQEKIAQLGSQNIIVKTVKPPEEQSSTGQQQTQVVYGLTYDDAERFHDAIPDVDIIVPCRILSQEAKYRTRRTSVEIMGTVPWHPEVSNVKVKYGRFITSTDNQYLKGVCVIDEQLVRLLFVIDDPIDQFVKIGTDYYRVVGIASSESAGTPSSTKFGLSANQQEEVKASASGANQGRIYIPVTTAKNRFGETIQTMSSGGAGRTMETVELQEIIIKAQSLDQVLVVRRSVEALLKMFHKKNDYEIIVPLELMRQARDLQRIFTIVLGSIAAISLLVGGIGIMNIMLATVSERTREIGIRRALGAKKKDIIFQFLMETLILTLAGGLFGVFLGCLIPFFVSRFAQMPTAITIQSIIMAFGISALIGIIFGLYPAYRAANLDPIESLRHE
jgi:putative ABC transport system permease protein